MLKKTNISKLLLAFFAPMLMTLFVGLTGLAYYNKKKGVLDDNLMYNFLAEHCYLVAFPVYKLSNLIHRFIELDDSFIYTVSTVIISAFYLLSIYFIIKLIYWLLKKRNKIH